MGVEGLVLVGTLRVLGGRLVALVLLLLARLLLWCLQTLSLVVVWTVLGYPALSLIAPLCAYPVEWGPIVLLLLGVGDKLLLLLWVLRIVLGRYLRLAVVVLLQERVKVLVLLVRRGQMRARPLVPLLSLKTMRLLQLLLCKPGIALPHRLASPYAVLARLLRGLFLLAVPGEARCDAAAKRLLRLLNVGRRLGLLRAAARLVDGGGQLGRARLLLLLVVLGHLIEMRAQTVRARRSRGILLAMLALGHTLRYLLGLLLAL